MCALPNKNTYRTCCKAFSSRKTSLLANRKRCCHQSHMIVPLTFMTD
uniref:Uncharacterized protein n=1 Tax=Anguilla anguilla TaxID=7936 RepID=A0A0E9S5N6_ANGAN